MNKITVGLIGLVGYGVAMVTGVVSSAPIDFLLSIASFILGG